MLLVPVSIKEVVMSFIPEKNQHNFYKITTAQQEFYAKEREFISLKPGADLFACLLSTAALIKNNWLNKLQDTLPKGDMLTSATILKNRRLPGRWDFH